MSMSEYVAYSPGMREPISSTVASRVPRFHKWRNQWLPCHFSSGQNYGCTRPPSTSCSGLDLRGRTCLGEFGGHATAPADKRLYDNFVPRTPKDSTAAPRCPLRRWLRSLHTHGRQHSDRARLSSAFHGNLPRLAVERDRLFQKQHLLGLRSDRWDLYPKEAPIPNAEATTSFAWPTRRGEFGGHAMALCTRGRRNG